MKTVILAALPVTKPVAIAIGVGALGVMFLAFKVGKFLMKMVLLLVALAALGMAVWWYYAAHQGAGL
jgi:hypothetical protein